MGIVLLSPHLSVNFWSLPDPSDITVDTELAVESRYLVAKKLEPIFAAVLYVNLGLKG